MCSTVESNYTLGISSEWYPFVGTTFSSACHSHTPHTVRVSVAMCRSFSPVDDGSMQMQLCVELFPLHETAS